MQIDASIVGKTIYAGGSSSVNIRENVTTTSRVIGNVSSGKAMGILTGKIFPDLDDPQRYDWYEVEFDGVLGYVRTDVASLSGSSSSSSGSASGSSASSGNYLKTAFDKPAGLPTWAIVAIAVSLLLIGVSVFFILKKKK